MTTLLLRCAGPLQSWGTRSRFGERDTELEPSKSGVIGLVCAALGRPRSEPVADLAALRMAVRVDRQGSVASDFQTAEGVAKADGSAPQTVLSRRYYLADASFLVALEGDADLLVRAHAALRDPHWPLALGRRSFVPGEPPWLPDGLVDTDAVTALRSRYWPTDRARRAIPALEAVIECGPGEDGEARGDVPLSFDHGHRAFAERRVTRRSITPIA